MPDKKVLVASLSIGALAGFLFASTIMFPMIVELKDQVQKDVVALTANNATIKGAAEQLKTCAEGWEFNAQWRLDRLKESQGSTVLIDLAHTQAMDVDTGQPIVNDPRIDLGSLRLTFPRNPGPSAPLWDIPGRVIPRVLNDNIHAVWGYINDKGKSEGWHVPAKEE